MAPLRGDEFFNELLKQDTSNLRYQRPQNFLFEFLLLSLDQS
jgi:hypothetical protein